MNILILGGTIFLGRHLVEGALKRGHRVTIFNRGLHGSQLYPQIEKLHGDRRDNLMALQNRQWDAVIDTNGYVPSIVQNSARLLAGNIKQYAFISSISVYADFQTIGVDENAPVGTLTPEQLAEAEKLIPPPGGVIAQAYGPAYGPLKALCEEAISEIMPGRVLAIRPGLIVGPYDYSDRFSYWVQRVARGGNVLAPGRPNRQVQIIDGRDLAEWTLDMVEAEQNGVYNATGPETTLTMGQLLQACQQATGSNATFTWLDESFLLEQEVQPWSQLPLWLPEENSDYKDLQGFLSIDIKRALAAGLRFRPLAETIHDTLAWDRQRSPDEKRHAGLEPERERELLQVWDTNQKGE